MSLRIAHLSDLHFYHRPTLRQAVGKRILGLANLYVKGRIHHFSAQMAEAAIQKVLEIKPDVVAITGDLTALASPEEFKMAKAALTPMLEGLKVIMIPGNHDYYTPGAHQSRRIEDYFRPYLEGLGQVTTEPLSYPTHHRVGPVRFFGLNPCRATVGSSGLLDGPQLDRLEGLLKAPREVDEYRILMIHYPILGYRGQVITKWSRRLNNREGLLRVLEAHPVDLILHGHDHLRYHNRLELGGQTVYIANAGSAAFAHREGHPIPASFNLYDIAGGSLERVRHYDWGAEGFFQAYDGPIPPVGPTFDRAKAGEVHAY